ncbi:MAG: hypothetical protein WC069_05065 [Candidatus Shapirobacteria bacterium]
MPKCIYRIASAERNYQPLDMRQEFAQPQSLPKCRVLVDGGSVDNECYNEDSSEANCKISPLCQKAEDKPKK